MIVKIKKLDPRAEITHGSELAAGYDLHAIVDGEVVIAPHTTEKINTGIAMEIPRGWFGGIYARSGLATREGLRPANCVGIVDSDYRGEIGVALFNDSDEERVITDGEKVAQLVIQPYATVKFVEAELSDTDRGEDGFGSTGK